MGARVDTVGFTFTALLHKPRLFSGLLIMVQSQLPVGCWLQMHRLLMLHVTRICQLSYPYDIYV